MATFVLVHGMWHGGWCWQRVTPLLRAAGHQVYTPTLTGLGERAHLWSEDIDLNTHVQDVLNVFEYEGLEQAILVGHSIGGALAVAVVDRIPARIAHLVNLAGPIPVDGMALKDLIGPFWELFQKTAILPGDEGRIQPPADWTFGLAGADLAWLKSKLVPHPLKCLTTPFRLGNLAARSIPRTYIACMEDHTLEENAALERKYTSLGWRYRSLPTGHDAMITMPEELAQILFESL